MKKTLCDSDIPEIVQMRLLRHAFLTSYGLPELFPFSKYLQHAQDTQISQLIRVRVVFWAVIFVGHQRLLGSGRQVP